VPCGGPDAEGLPGGEGLGELDVERVEGEELGEVCYDDGLAYEVALAEARAGGLVVRDIVDRDYQPALADEEVETAIQLARDHRLVASHLRPEFDADTILASAVEPGDEHHGLRRVAVVFGYPDERLPRVHALVDLTSSRLVSVHIREDEHR
jgi:hypothetical protein